MILQVKKYGVHFPLMAFFGCLILFASCEKKLKKTTTLDMKFTSEVGSPVDSVFFVNSIVTLKSIEFDGERKQGSSISFTDELEQPITIDLSSVGNTSSSSSYPMPSFNYDIPQGTYTTFEFTIRIADNGSAYSEFRGYYLRKGWGLFPIILRLNKNTKMLIHCTDINGSRDITLVEGNPAVATIKMKPELWFDEIKAQHLLDNAQAISISGVPTIIISQDNNKNIYDMVISRMNQTFQAVIK